MRSSWIQSRTLKTMTSVSVRDRMGGDAETQREGGHVKTVTQSGILKPRPQQTMPRSATHQQKLERGMNALSLGASRGTQL